MSKEIVLEVSDLHKTFHVGFLRKRVEAVRGVSFGVQRGEIFGFIGPNGAGKTTSIKMMLQLIFPTRGQVKLFGQSTFDPSARRRLGYLPENPPLYPELTVRQYLNFVAEIKDVPRARRKACVDRAIDRATLREVAGKRIAALSKGFKQRVEVRDLLVGLRGEHTIILSTHILPEVSQITDRVVIINRGKVMAVDSPRNLSQRLRGREEVIVEIGGADAQSVREAVAAVPGVVGVEVSEADAERLTARIQSDLGTDVRGEVARVLAGRWRLLGLRSESLSLEEIFLKLTGDGPDAPAGKEG